MIFNDHKLDIFNKKHTFDLNRVLDSITPYMGLWRVQRGQVRDRLLCVGGLLVCIVCLQSGSTPREGTFEISSSIWLYFLTTQLVVLEKEILPYFPCHGDCFHKSETFVFFSMVFLTFAFFLNNLLTSLLDYRTDFKTSILDQRRYFKTSFLDYIFCILTFPAHCFQIIKNPLFGGF